MGLGDWFDERTGHRALVRVALDEPVPGGARWAYVWGSALTITLVLQAVTGWLLMSAYAPSATTAWASVHYISFTMKSGWIVRGLHHFGAQAMVILLGLHLGQTALYGAYRKPREMNSACTRRRSTPARTAASTNSDSASPSASTASTSARKSGSTRTDATVAVFMRPAHRNRATSRWSAECAQINRAIASPISVVDALPPKSRVRGPSASTCSMARTMASCASRWPRKSSINAPDQIIATGLAMFWP